MFIRQKTPSFRRFILYSVSNATARSFSDAIFAGIILAINNKVALKAIKPIAVINDKPAIFL